MNPLIIINIFLIVLAVFSVLLAAQTCCDKQFNGPELLQLRYSVLWGSLGFRNPLTNPLVWVLHLAYGISMAKWLIATAPASDMIFVISLLTGIAALAYLVTFIMRLHLVNKSLVYSTLQLERVQTELDRRVPSRTGSGTSVIL